MAEHFFDTSAVVKHYRAEIGTAKVDALVGAVTAVNWVSSLGVVELHSVMARLVRMGEITATEFQTVCTRFLADIAAGLWQVLPVTSADFQKAQDLVSRHGTTRSLRTLDALQLAVALGQHGASPLTGFVCADANLCVVTAVEGLAVFNPEIP